MFVKELLRSDRDTDLGQVTEKRGRFIDGPEIFFLSRLEYFHPTLSGCFLKKGVEAFLDSCPYWTD